MSGTIDNWFTQTGSWTTAADWSTGLPGAASNASLFGTVAYAVTYATNAIINQLDGTGTLATLDLASGSLDVLAGGSFAGIIDQTGGTLTVAPHSNLTLTTGGGTLAGTQNGTGALTLRGTGTYALAAGDLLAVATLALADAGTALLLGAPESYAGRLLLGGGTTLALGGHALTLTSHALNPTDSGGNQVSGVLAGPGSVVVTGTAGDGGAQIDFGATLVDQGLVTEDNGIGIAAANTTDTGTLSVASGAIYDLLNDNGIGSRGTATVQNAGVFEKTGVNGTSTIVANFANTGTILVSAGAIGLRGSNTLGGTLTGTGELDLQGGVSTLQAGLALTVGTLAIGSSATVDLAGALADAGHFALTNGSTLFLGGNNLALSGSTALGGEIVGPGTVTTAGSTDLAVLTLAAGATLVDSNLVTQDNAVTVGVGTADASGVVVVAGATYDLLSDVNLGSSGIGALHNAGLFEKTGVTGTSLVDIPFDNTGTLDVLTGVVALQAGGTLGGTLTGTGELILAVGGTYSLAPGLALTVASLELLNDGAVTALGQSLSYGGAFSIEAGSTLELDGFALSLTGTRDALNGRIYGPGSLVVAGASEIGGQYFSAGAALAVTGTVIEDNFVDLGVTATDSALLAIAAGGTYDLIDDNGISGTGTATVQNAGLLEKTGVTGTSAITAAVINTGTIAVDAGAVSLQAVSSSTGAIDVQNGTFVAQTTLTGGGSVQIGAHGDASFLAAAVQNVAFTGAGGTLEIAVPAAFQGAIAGFAAGDTIELLGIQVNGLSATGNQLTLTDTVNGTISTSYTLDVTGIANAGALTLVEDANGGTDVLLGHAGPAFTTPAEEIYQSTWITDANGTWTAAGNWSTQVPIGGGETLAAVVPGTGNDAGINPAGAADFDIAYDTTDTVNQLTGSTLGTIDLTGGTLTVNQGGGFGGAMVLTGGTLDAVGGLNIDGGFDLAAGAVAEVDSLSLAAGGGTLAGTVVGNGELFLIGGDTFTVDPGFTVTTVSWDLGVNGDGFGSATTLATNLSYAGLFGLDQYSGNAANLALNGFTLTLTGGAVFEGAVSGPGALLVGGTGDVDGLSVGTLAVLDDLGTLTAEGGLSLAGTMLVAAGGTYDLLGDVGIGQNAASVVQNAGLFEKTGVDGTSAIAAGSFVNTGTILAAAGVLQFDTGNALLGGTMTGPGSLQLRGGGAYQITAAAVLTVGTLELAVSGNGSGSATTLDGSRVFAGTFLLDDDSGNAAVLDLAGNTLSLTGPAALDGAIAGGGTLAVLGSADLSGFGSDALSTVAVSGTLTQDGGFGLGGTLLIAAGGTFNLLDDQSIGNSATAVIGNAGLLEKTGVDGTSYVSGNLTDTGSIAVDAGTMLLSGNDTLAGPVGGPGALVFGGGGADTLAPGFALTTSRWELGVNGDGFGSATTLESSLTYGGAFAIDDYSGNNANLYLNGRTLTLSGTAELVGGVQGTGAVVLSGSADFNGFYDSGVVDLTGHATQEGNSTILGTLAIAAAGVLDFINDGVFNGSPLTTNAGLFEKTGVDGVTQVTGSFANTGAVSVTAGSFQFQGMVANDATMAIGPGAGIDFRSLLGADAGGSGVVTLAAGASLEADGAVAASQTIDLAGTADVLLLGTPGSFAGTLAGFAAGDTIDLLGITATNAAIAGGVLSVTNGTLAVGTIALLGTVGSSPLVTSDGNGGTDLVLGADLTSLPVATRAAVQTAIGAYPHTGGTSLSTAVSAGGLAAPVVGNVNIAAFSGFAAGGSLALPAGYQVGALLGTLAAALSDSGGNAVLVGNTGADTLVGGGDSDTLIGGGGGNNLFALGGGNAAITTGGGSSLVFFGTGPDTVTSNGDDTLVAGAGAATVTASGAVLMFGGGGPLAFDGGAGSVSVVSGAGSATVTAGVGGGLIFGGTGSGVYYGGAGPTVFIGGSGSATYIGGAGSTTLFGGTSAGVYYDGAGGGIFVNGASGNTVVQAGLGDSTVFGGGSGDVITVSGTNSTLLTAGSGAETLNGAASSANTEVYAGTGSDVVLGGSGDDTLIAGTGSVTMTGGAGGNVFGFFDGGAGGSDVITDLTAADRVVLFGYGGGEQAADLAAQQHTAAGTVLTLSDHTTILLQGIASVSASNLASF